ncbi:MAG: hypothetical protein R6V04_10380 [bacterium]
MTYQKFLKEYSILILLIIIGALLRLKYLSLPFWIDEVLFYNWVTKTPKQAFFPVLLFKFYGLFVDLKNPVLLRLPFVAAGLGCISVVWFYFKNYYIRIFMATLMACFPLFVYWSAIAKIYVFAWLLIALAWKWKFFYILLALTTPVGVVGFNFFEIKKNYKIYLLSIGIIGLLFIFRGDTERNFLDWRFMSHAKRIWSVFIFSAVMHIMQFIDTKRLGKGIRKKKV